MRVLRFSLEPKNTWETEVVRPLISQTVAPLKTERMIVPTLLIEGN